MPRILLTYENGERSPRLSSLLDAMWSRWGVRNVEQLIGDKIVLGAKRDWQHALEFHMVVLVIGERTRAFLRQRARRPRGAIEINQMINLLHEVRDDHVRFMVIVIDEAPVPEAGDLPGGLPPINAEDVRMLDDDLSNLDDILTEIEGRIPPPRTDILFYPPAMDDAASAPPTKPPTGTSDAFPSSGHRAEPPHIADAPTAGAEAPQSAGTDPQAETVRLGASAPSRVAPGDEFTARFVAYVAALEEAVRARLASLSPRSTSHLGTHTCQWKPGTEVVAALCARGLVINPPEQRFTWSGTDNLLEFDVSIPADAQPGTIVLKFDAAVDGIVVARLRFDLDISADGARTPAVPITTSAAAARTAFASYSSADRLRVLDRISAVRIATGIDVFVDCLDLRPSEQWKTQLDAEITKRDLFLLFWSKSASESKWVDWEWRTALDRHGEDALQVHPLDIGVKPPAELKHIHFGDKYMVARKAFDVPR